MESLFTALPASRKQDQVASVVRRAILHGDLQPGERIIELALARQLEVSQAPVREALAALAREGLVVKVAHRGTFVSPFHARDLRELFTLRALLDAYSARLAAERVSDEDLDQLRALLERMRAAERDWDLPSLTEAHVEFHERIYELSGHALLGEIFALIRSRMTLALDFAENLFRADGEEAECHVPLLEALSDHDPDRAERAARDRMLAWIDLVIVEGDGKQPLPTAQRPRRRRRAPTSASA